MARLTGPEDGSRLVYVLRPDNALGTAAGFTAVLYADEDATVPADILTVDGDPITDSQVTVDATSLLPLVQFPDGVDVLYAVVNGGPVSAVYARVTSGGGGAVDSVFTRTGAVTAQTGDYTAAQVGADPAGTAASAVAVHSADTTAVHGITDTAALETSSGATAKVTAHAAATDPHGDRAYADTGDALKLAKASNLSDLANAGTARTNLGLGTAATKNTGTTTGTVAAGDDSRLSDTRTPTDGTVTNAKVAVGAAIALSKLATDPLARANHTGTQTASTVSDFDTQVRTSRLDQMATAGADVALGTHKLTGVTDPASAQDAATKNYVDTAAFGTWTNFPSLGTNVTLGTPNAQYRTAPGNMLQLRGQLAMTGAVAANFTMTTLPFSFAAARQFNVRVIGLGANVFVNITTGGAMSQSGTLANTHTMNFDGIEISL